uniref:Uncharacterized protein n=1 Tax=Arundo donax TaxID=35708 RepID=A0A0A8Y115_ARUDO
MEENLGSIYIPPFATNTIGDQNRQTNIEFTQLATTLDTLGTENSMSIN